MKSLLIITCSSVFCVIPLQITLSHVHVLLISQERISLSFSPFPLPPHQKNLSFAVFWVVMFNLRIRQKPTVCLEQLISFQETFTGRERPWF